MAYKIVKLNKARCKKCGDVLISHREDKEEKCGCGALVMGGGHSWIKRTGKSGVDFEELAVLNFEEVPEVFGKEETDQPEQTEG
jgi:dissimilatory sulfite reductase (desulfoviridin) alpha/beta subunit